MIFFQIFDFAGKVIARLIIRIAIHVKIFIGFIEPTFFCDVFVVQRIKDTLGITE